MALILIYEADGRYKGISKDRLSVWMFYKLFKYIPFELMLPYGYQPHNIIRLQGQVSA